MSKLTDHQLAASAKVLMQDIPDITRNQLRQKLGIQLPHLKKLEEQGLIVLPAKLSPKQRGQRAAKASPKFRQFGKAAMK